MLQNLLSGLGLDEDEVKTYLGLLENGPATVSALASRIGKPRPSLYGFLKRLREKGMVLESSKAGVKTFYAESPEKVSLLFQKKIEELEDKHSLYKNLLPDLEKNASLKFLNPKFQLFEGERGLQHILKDMLLYSNIQTQAFWPIKSMLDILSADFFEYLNKERIKNKIYTRAIWPHSQAVDVKKYPYLGAGKEFLREIRLAPKQIDFSMGYWIYGNKVAFISSRKESFGFIIESKELVEMLLAQFEVIWNISKPLITNPKDSTAFLERVKR